MFLLDTNVVSELRKMKSGRAEPRVVGWFSSIESEKLFVSAITMLEIEIGILRLENRDPAQAIILRTWFEQQVLPFFKGRILSVDLDVARRCAALHFPNPRPERDALIAATALVNGCSLVTRNSRDFQGMDLQIIDPWSIL